ncbi:Sulfotransferase 1C4-like 4 [Homarus americanus]|uniref:Sulfotransferase 1C4-like 4 n=1 Tax=Homarus americanus TaxID=6706 RepID=A0A8J5JMD5_HOMAM|nr:Sulfotransferase 1C4-like 4 [Homarus americanus]
MPFLGCCKKRNTMSLASGHNLVSLEGEELARQERDWQGYSEGIVRLHPGRWLFPSTFKRFADEYYNFKLKPDDVVLLTWPKCGTTWLQEIMWTMRYNPDLNNPMAAAPVNARVPFLEEPENGVFLQMCELAPEPRTFKSHLALPLLPTDLLKTSKAVYMARNPKDAVVSFFHHSRIFKNHDFKGTFEEFVQYFLDDDCVYGPYWLHLKEAWKQRKNPNLHFMFFEDLKNNNMEELKKLDKFLGTNLSQEQLDNVAHYTSFAEMKARKVGDWKGKYTPELEAKMDKWIKKNLGDFGIEFKYGV